MVIEAPNDYAAACFRQYGMNTDDTGRYSAMYKPFHLIGLELNISILLAALLNKPTGSAQAFTADVVATAKADMKARQIQDGEGVLTVWGKLYPAEKSVALGGLPIGLAHGIKLKTDIAAHSLVRWQDIEIINPEEVVQMRRAVEKSILQQTAAAATQNLVEYLNDGPTLRSNRKQKHGPDLSKPKVCTL